MHAPSAQRGILARIWPRRKPTKKRKVSLDTILSTVERGFADIERKMDRGFAAVADDITDIKSTMATKADVRNIVGEELAAIRTELKSIRLDLDDLKEKSRTSPRFHRKTR